MDIKTFSILLRREDLLLFSVREAGILLSSRDRNIFILQLHQWSRKGWLRRLKRGLYELAYPESSVISDFHVANRLYEPSYISLETALSHYQILPETAAQVTSATPKPTRRFKNTHGVFTYFSLRPGAFKGYALLRLQGRFIRIAEPEKAVVDRFYAGLRRGEPFELITDRWDRHRLKRLSKNKMLSYAKLFGAYRGKLKEALHALLR